MPIPTQNKRNTTDTINAVISNTVDRYYTSAEAMTPDYSKAVAMATQAAVTVALVRSGLTFDEAYAEASSERVTGEMLAMMLRYAYVFEAPEQFPTPLD
jgi:hypothetical protein